VVKLSDHSQLTYHKCIILIHYVKGLTKLNSYTLYNVFKYSIQFLYFSIKKEDYMYLQDWNLP
jgi:hypothetical protein